VFVNGVSQGTQTVVASLNSVVNFTSYNVNWTGLSFSQTDINTLEVQLNTIGNLSGGPNRRALHVDFVEITASYSSSCTDDTLTLSSAAGTDDQSVCINSPIFDISYAVGGDATGASVNGLPAGVSGSYIGGVFTISGTPSASGVFIYTVTTTGTPSGCNEATLNGTIDVDGNLT